MGSSRSSTVATVGGTVKQSVKRGVEHPVKRRGAGISGAFAKDMLRMWARNWKRFVSIAIISMLGVAVLTGIYAGCRDMFRGADRFLDNQRLYDIQVISTLGLTEDDVAALKAVRGVERVQAERSAAATVTVDGSGESVTLTEIGTNGMNQPYLQEGKLPVKSGEVAVTRKFVQDSGLKVGDELSVTLGASTSSSGSSVPDASGTTGNSSGDASVDASSDSDIPGDSSGSTTDSSGSDAASADTSNETPTFPTDLTITGIVLDPLDLQNPEGYSTGAFRSSATADYTFFLPSDGVTGSVTTAISLGIRGSSALDTFSDQYDDAVREVRDRIENNVQTKRQKARRQQLIDEAKRKIADARAEADQRFADAQTTLNDQRSQFNAQIDQIIAASGSAGAELVTQAAQDGTDQAAAAALDIQRNAVIVQSSELTQAKQQLDNAQTQLDQQKARTTAELDKQESSVETTIPQARWYVNTRSAAGTFSSLKSDLSSIESIGRAFPVVFLLVAVLMSLTAMTRMVEEDRGLIGTYMGLGYGSGLIASRYVLFALLACLIGGGLGDLIGFLGIPAFLLIVLEGMYVVPGTTLLYDWLYGSAGVLLFVVGVGAATVVACRGEMRRMPAELMRPKSPKAGSRVLLERIGPLWRRMKFLNKVTARNLFRFKGRLFMTVGGVAGCTALIVCGLAINDTVDALPVTQYQDVYRYDLMVVTDHDDLDAVRSRLVSDGKIADSTTSSVGAMTLARVESGEITTGADESETVQLITVPAAADLADIVSLRLVAGGTMEQYRDGTAIGLAAAGAGSSAAGKSADGSASAANTNDGPVFAGDGVIVSQSAANALGVKAGDEVTLENGDAARETARVYAVSESVIGADVYLTAGYYREVFGGDGSGDGDSAAHDDTATEADGVEMNAIFARYTGSDDDQIAYADELAKESDVLSVVSTADMQRRFSFDLMGAVVALIVALAGALALVVLFTLANTNVSERVREMATLKVLGFFDREVHRYVNREMLILTLMGIAVGLPLGRWIGGLLTAALNMPGLYFAVTVRWASYAIAAAVTLAFALLVQLFTNPVLDRIDPVSSLKSVE
ncbi:FtsX-like permease family protein [Bifidobacterium miconisargentati]|uniref:FtsX-like permease family protein n=1 Tax=Bifidobacterium miconisargentati TaxID=2834437 RepID=UPI001BDC06C0|nr:FtsX-like permease family protein [Bifidobacterium miconisargentati]